MLSLNDKIKGNEKKISECYDFNRVKRNQEIFKVEKFLREKERQYNAPGLNNIIADFSQAH